MLDAENSTNIIPVCENVATIKEWSAVNLSNIQHLLWQNTDDKLNDFKRITNRHHFNRDTTSPTLFVANEEKSTLVRSESSYSFFNKSYEKYRKAKQQIFEIQWREDLDTFNKCTQALYHSFISKRKHD